LETQATATHLLPCDVSSFSEGRGWVLDVIFDCEMATTLSPWRHGKGQGSQII